MMTDSHGQWRHYMTKLVRPVPENECGAEGATAGQKYKTSNFARRQQHWPARAARRTVAPLAHQIERLIETGVAADSVDQAKLRPRRARVTQIMNLLVLAPDIQEQILCWPAITQGKDPVSERGCGQFWRRWTGVGRGRSSTP